MANANIGDVLSPRDIAEKLSHSIASDYINTSPIPPHLDDRRFLVVVPFPSTIRWIHGTTRARMLIARIMNLMAETPRQRGMGFYFSDRKENVGYPLPVDICVTWDKLRSIRQLPVREDEICIVFMFSDLEMYIFILPQDRL